MVMTEKEWKASFDKWNNVCHTLVEMKQIINRMYWLHTNIYGNCTYCKNFRRNYWDDHPEAYENEELPVAEYNCGLCPLYRVDACVDNREGNPTSHFWLLVKAVDAGRWKHAHGHAVKILQAITDSKLEVTGRSVDDYLRETNG